MGFGHKVNNFVQEITCSTIVTAQQPIRNCNVGFGRDSEYLFCGQSMFKSTIYHPGIIQLSKCIVLFSKGFNKLIPWQFKYYKLKSSCGYRGTANI